MILLLSQALPPQGLNPSPELAYRREIVPGERLLIGRDEVAVAPDGRIRLRDGRRVPAVRRNLDELARDLATPVFRLPRAEAGVPLLNPERLGQTLRVATGTSLSDALSGLIEFDAVVVIDASDRSRRVVKSDWGGCRLRPGDALALIPVAEVRPVSIIGGVIQSGEFEWHEDATLGEAIARRGGLAARALGNRIAIERAGKTLGPFALPNDAALALRPGDLVRVPLSGEPAVYVSVAGYVKRPGLVELRPGAKLSDVIADAGGLTVAPERLIVRIRSSLEPRRKPLLLPGTEIAKAPPLQKGDVVEIGAPPATGREVAALSNASK